MKRRLEMLRILWTLYQSWRRHPTERLCQLIVNAAGISRPEPPPSYSFRVADLGPGFHEFVRQEEYETFLWGTDPFYTEDEEIESRLVSY